MAAGSILLPSLACSNKKDATTALEDEASEAVKTKDIGVQIYSVRNQLKEDFNGALKKLAEIGYKYIEGYGLGLDGVFLQTIAPKEFNKIVSDLGMELISTHCSYFTADEAQKTIDASLEARLQYVIIPSLPNELKESVETYKQVAENFNKVGELFKPSGLKFGYHNHAFEFEEKDGQVPLEILLNETQADLVTFEADLFWVVKGGTDPMDLINKFPGRFSLFHVKDMDENQEQTTVGSGNLDFETILNSREKAGLKYYFVEDERTDDPFGNLKAAFDYLNASDFG